MNSMKSNAKSEFLVSSPTRAFSFLQINSIVFLLQIVLFTSVILQVQGWPSVFITSPFKGSLVRNHLQTCRIKCEERISQLSVIPSKRNHEVWSHREEGPGSHCSIGLPIQWLLCALRINQYLTKIVKVKCLSTKVL